MARRGYNQGADGKFITKVEWERFADTIVQTQEEIYEELRDQIRDFGDDAVDIYRSYAPTQSGRLHAGISATDLGDFDVVVEVEAIDPKTGFDYAPVTRFGHETDPIVPVNGGKALKTKIPKPPGPFFASVRGVSVSHDWADDARASLDNMLENAESELKLAVIRAWRDRR